MGLLTVQEQCLQLPLEGNQLNGTLLSKQTEKVYFYSDGHQKGGQHYPRDNKVSNSWD